MHICAQLNGQRIIHQYYVLSALRQSKTTVFAEGSAGSAQICCLQAINTSKIFIAAQGAHI